MTRQDVVAFLARTVNSRLMTEEQAIEALKSFDNGTFPLTELPIPPEEFITGLTPEMIAKALE